MNIYISTSILWAPPCSEQTQSLLLSEGVQMFPAMSVTFSLSVCVHLCARVRARVPPLPPRGLALCWRQRCPGASRLRWGSAPPGPDTAPTHTSSSSPSPGQTPVRQKHLIIGMILSLIGFIAHARKHMKADSFTIKPPVTSADKEKGYSHFSLISSRPFFIGWLGHIPYAAPVIVLTGSPSTMSPLGLRITIMTWAWKVMISTGPCSIIFPIANCKTKSTADFTCAAVLLQCQQRNICYTYINVINVEDFGLETEPECFGLLDRVGQLTVRLRTDQKHI